MAEITLDHAGLLDSLSNIYNAIAALKASAIERDSDVILSLQHAAEGLLSHAEAAMKEGARDAQSAAFVRIGCLADLIDKVNADIDDQLLYAASVLLHLANAQLVAPEAA
ncbi:hypothetical protein [Hydrogenophaga sp. BPS33]|uniref:hypothetical protein n=1 Tax=Hydrogenophaga sp. BPS33 TaxID=2651974 RepID=UPI00131FCECB|nr:hypothetical protein [Hydrogenophaga sp. BPS33]QHE86501.1 hypothetical protein F9K07_17140 [Hydrogenophaga sp. BPS33]